MKCRFKTNKTLTAISNRPYYHHGRRKLLHEKLASNPLKFQPPKKPEEARKPTNRCRRCGKISQGDLFETHRRLMAETLKQDEASTSKSFLKCQATRPNREPSSPSRQTARAPMGRKQYSCGRKHRSR